MCRIKINDTVFSELYNINTTLFLILDYLIYYYFYLMIFKDTVIKKV